MDRVSKIIKMPYNENVTIYYLFFTIREFGFGAI